jgi:hypothetical protein
VHGWWYCSFAVTIALFPEVTNSPLGKSQPYAKIKLRLGCTSEVQCLASRSKALGLIPTTAQKKKKKKQRKKRERAALSAMLSLSTKLYPELGRLPF